MIEKNEKKEVLTSILCGDFLVAFYFNEENGISLVVHNENEDCLLEIDQPDASSPVWIRSKEKIADV